MSTPHPSAPTATVSPTPGVGSCILSGIARSPQPSANRHTPHPATALALAGSRRPAHRPRRLPNIARTIADRLTSGLPGLRVAEGWKLTHKDEGGIEGALLARSWRRIGYDIGYGFEGRMTARLWKLYVYIAPTDRCRRTVLAASSTPPHRLENNCPTPLVTESQRAHPSGRTLSRTPPSIPPIRTAFRGVDLVSRPPASAPVTCKTAGCLMMLERMHASLAPRNLIESAPAGFLALRRGICGRAIITARHRPVCEGRGGERPLNASPWEASRKFR